jgi:hypothetical protein
MGSQRYCLNAGSLLGRLMYFKNMLAHIIAFLSDSLSIGISIWGWGF